MLAAVACEAPRPTLVECGVYDWGGYYMMSYETEPDSVSADGIPVDTSGQDMTLHHLDRMAREARDCILDAYPSLILPPEVLEQTYCVKRDFSREFAENK